MTKAFNGSTDVPLEVVEYKLCEKFGWTPQQLDEQPKEIIDKFMAIMSIENQLQQQEAKANVRH